MKTFARMLERVLERLMGVVAARVEASLDMVAANAQRELLEEAARHASECELGGELLAKKLIRAADRFDDLASDQPPALPRPAAPPSSNGAPVKSTSSGKGKRGRPRKTEAQCQAPEAAEITGPVITPALFDEEQG